jgi:hypothetical protein
MDVKGQDTRVKLRRLHIQTKMLLGDVKEELEPSFRRVGLLNERAKLYLRMSLDRAETEPEEELREALARR